MADENTRQIFRLKNIDETIEERKQNGITSKERIQKFEETIDSQYF